MKSCEGPDSAKQPHLILLQVKLDYIPNILPQTGCPPKFVFRLQRLKWAKSAIFANFFVFSNMPAKLLILKENFCLLKFRSHRDASFLFLNSYSNNFQPNYCGKNRLDLSNLRKLFILLTCNYTLIFNY